jgi:hypothetical protein
MLEPGAVEGGGVVGMGGREVVACAHGLLHKAPLLFASLHCFLAVFFLDAVFV